MYLISTKGYDVRLLIEKETGIIWVSMKNVQDGLGVQNISDLVLKEIYGIYKTKNLTQEQIKKYKMAATEIFEKYPNLSENELNTKTKKFMPKMMLWLLLLNAAEVKKRCETKIDGIRKKLIPGSEISECPECDTKSNQK